MSYEATKAVWEHSKAKTGARLVLLCIAYHVNTEGIAWPSIPTIAAEANMSPRQVSRAVSELVDKWGELEIVEKGSGRGNPTIYRLRLPGFTTGKDDNMSSNTSVKDDNMSRFPVVIKGDNLSEKDDISAQRVTNGALKDDNMSPELKELTIEPKVNGNSSPRANEPEVIPVPPGGSFDDFDMELVDMVNALGTVCRENVFYDKHHDRLKSAAQALLRKGITPEQVKVNFEKGDTYWYQASHGKKGDQPWASNVVGEIDAALAWQGGGANEDEMRRKAEQAFDWLVGQGSRVGRHRYKDWGVTADIQQIMVKALGPNCIEKVTGVNPHQYQQDFVNEYLRNGGALAAQRPS